jgi:hypothetical protein
MGIEPENGPARWRQTTKSSYRRVAIPAQDYWKLTGSADCAYRDSDAPHEFKGSANLRWRLIRVSLNHLNVRDRMSPTLEMCSKPGLEQVLRPGTAAPLTSTGVVGNEEELNIHTNL